MLRITLLLILIMTQSWADELRINKILRLEISSSINPATFSYLKSGYDKAKKKNFDAILIEMNTPGGLVSTTKEILTLMSEMPTIIWITPEGASATSAGAIISSGAHLLYMSEGTNIGAATPIQMSGDLDKKSDLRKKSINDLVALVQSLSQARGRNPKPFAQMIEKASSFEATEALKMKLINGIVNSESELITHLGRVTHLKIKGMTKNLVLNTPRIESHEMDLGQKLLNILANPSTAYILFLIGAALIYLEFQAPGGFLAGSIGGVCLLLAAIGFQVLPLNFGALGLMILSFALFIMEAYITSYGILSIAGVLSLTAGSLFLFRTDNGYISLSLPIIFAAIGAIITFLGIIISLMIKERKNIGRTHFNEPQNQRGEILKYLKEDNSYHYYQIKVNGEVWKAQCKEKLNLGDSVFTLDKIEDTMTLKIAPTDSEKEKNS